MSYQARNPSAMASTQATAPSATKELFSLFIRYLPKTTTDADLNSMFSKWSSVCEVCVFRWSRLNKRNFAIVVFSNDVERAAALEELQEPHVTRCSFRTIFWKESPSSLYCLRKREVSFKVHNIGHEVDFPEWNGKWLSKHENDQITPGCMAMLPPFHCRKPALYYDPRLEAGAFHHPVIILGHWGDGLYAILVCSSFHGLHGSERRFTGHLDKEYLQQRRLELESFTDRRPWGYRNDSDDDEPEVETNDKIPTYDMLKLGDRPMPNRTFVSTKIYLGGKNALVRLYEHPPSHRTILNLDFLLERVKNVEPHFYEPHDPRWHPAYRGGRADEKPLKQEPEKATQSTSTSPKED